MTTTDAPSATASSLTVHDDGVAELRLEGRAGKPFILDEPAVAELEAHVAALHDASDVRGVLVTSSHDRVFCAGADVAAIAGLTDPEEARRISRRGQDLFQEIEELRVPVVALVHGTCVGGGLELALACHVRVVSDDPATRLGLPEVQLGILPAWGGTTRLVDLLGPRVALPMLLAGRTVDGTKAARIGLAAERVPRSMLRDRGLDRLADLRHAWEHGHHSTPTFRRVGLGDYLLEHVDALGRSYAKLARKRVLAETRGLYPAPLEIADAVAGGFGAPREERFRAEQDALARLAPGPVCKHLVSIFTRNRDKERGSPYDQAGPETPRIDRVGIVGAGVMGAGIALALLLKGRHVRLIDPFPEALVKARRMIQRELAARRRRRRLDRHEERRILDRLLLTHDYRGLRAADLVIEAVPEVPAIKHEALRLADAAVLLETPIATNTSSLPVSELAEQVRNRGGFCGLHFFNPAPKMPLVEIVRTDHTDEETVVRLVRFVRDLGKTPVVVADSPAFVVNRILAPYLLAAFEMLDEGAPVTEVDRAARGFGLPMGPFELMDTIGLDVVHHVCRYLAGIPEMGMTLPRRLDEMVERGRLGEKTGRGFYHHERGRRRRPAVRPGSTGAPPEGEAILRRLLGALEQEARRVLDENVVASEDDLDLASIFGMGFPPHTGGIATWMREKDEEPRP